MKVGKDLNNAVALENVKAGEVVEYVAVESGLKLVLKAEMREVKAWTGGEMGKLLVADLETGAVETPAVDTPVRVLRPKDGTVRFRYMGNRPSE